MAVKLDIAGFKFGRLTAIKTNGFDISPSRKHIRWDCICECGNLVNTRLNTLRTDSVKSCGCLKKEGTNFKHGLIQLVEYHSWAHMKSRCLNNKCKDFYLYGGRGISVCKRWADSFLNFIEDMGLKPASNYSIDRIDVNGNYEKSNCRWADPITQANNKRNSTTKGELKLTT